MVKETHASLAVVEIVHLGHSLVACSQSSADTVLNEVTKHSLYAHVHPCLD